MTSLMEEEKESFGESDAVCPISNTGIYRTAYIFLSNRVG